MVKKLTVRVTSQAKIQNTNWLQLLKCYYFMISLSYMIITNIFGYGLLLDTPTYLNRSHWPVGDFIMVIFHNFLTFYGPNNQLRKFLADLMIKIIANNSLFLKFKCCLTVISTLTRLNCLMETLDTCHVLVQSCGFVENITIGSQELQ